jgi:tRNA (guanine-N7-)-methyltransferase
LGELVTSDKPFTVEVLASFFSSLSELKNCEIEIGCGNGHFIAEYGARFPDTLLLGVDIKEKRCRKAIKKIKRKGLTNTSIIRGRAEECLQLLPPQRLTAFHIYFPDPWPKKKHQRRRFFKLAQLQQMYQCLKPGGRIYFATDMYDYYLQAKLLLLLHPGFELMPEFPPEEMYNSVFCQRFTAVLDPIYTVIGQKIK